MRKRVLFIANYFPPISGPGSIRPYFFAKYLLEKGHELTIVSAKTDPIYKTDNQFEKLNGKVRFHRFSNNDFGKFSKALLKLRLFKFFWFFFTKIFFERQFNWYNQANKFLKKEYSGKDFDLIYATTGPFLSGILANKLGKRWYLPYILDMRDPFTMSPARKWPSYHHWKYFSKLENRVISESYKTLVVAKGMKDEFLEKYKNLEPDKIDVIYNGFDGNLNNVSENFANDKLIIGYSGSLHDYEGEKAIFKINKSKIPFTRVNYNVRTRSLFHLIEGMKHLSAQEVSKIEIRIFGQHNLTNTLEQIKNAGLTDAFRFMGKVPFKQVNEHLVKCHTLLLPMEERIDGKMSYFITGKVFEYIKANKPIFLLGQKSELMNIIEKVGCDFYFSENKANEIKKQLKLILEDFKMGNLKQNNFVPNELQNFNRRSLSENLNNIIEGLG